MRRGHHYQNCINFIPLTKPSSANKPFSQINSNQFRKKVKLFLIKIVVIYGIQVFRQFRIKGI